MTFQTGNVLEVENLSVYFGRLPGSLPVVREVSFTAVGGQTLAVVGESGSGKSVTGLALLSLLNRGLSKVTGSGNFYPGSGPPVDLLHLDTRKMRALRGDRVAMIFQEPMTSLNPSLTLGYQVGEALRIHRGASRRQARAEAIEMLERVGIPDAPRRADSYPHEISGGMRQRVMIASAMISRPTLLIADEPTTALDVTIQAQILDELKKLQEEMGMSMIFITHDLGVVAEIAHAVLVMYAGQVVEQGPVRRVLERPRHPYTRALLASVPRLDRPKTTLAAIAGRIPDPQQPIAGCRFHPRCPYCVRGLCDVREPELDDIDGIQSVRCVRWPELEAA
ncbi:peptide/nickel transport system ATP-binding protein [Phyllobacterium trifolii]|uniref:Peptide/nickel transport system ATP-binding protein n=1 Tax=Phyllobacterium trifolii TaxID=300193 RepID=A0A839UDF3_9HYPH|nr:ABC transporter ATP-binding protein [Phyllobacterium trifolii]MBB3146902.1 peptide/nickel transport system ATP-binding protein [Phyllobacterium trifolii]